MGEIADDLIDRMMEDDWFHPCEPRQRGYARYSHDLMPRKKKKPAPAGVFDEQTRAAEFPSKKTDPSLLRDYPEKTFDMGFFPTIPKKKEEPDPWALGTDDAPF